MRPVRRQKRVTPSAHTSIDFVMGGRGKSWRVGRFEDDDGEGDKGVGEADVEACGAGDVLGDARESF